MVIRLITWYEPRLFLVMIWHPTGASGKIEWWLCPPNPPRLVLGCLPWCQLLLTNLRLPTVLLLRFLWMHYGASALILWPSILWSIDLAAIDLMVHRFGGHRSYGPSIWRPSILWSIDLMASILCPSTLCPSTCQYCLILRRENSENKFANAVCALLNKF